MGGQILSGCAAAQACLPAPEPGRLSRGVSPFCRVARVRFFPSTADLGSLTKTGPTRSWADVGENATAESSLYKALHSHQL